MIISDLFFSKNTRSFHTTKKFSFDNGLAYLEDEPKFIFRMNQTHSNNFYRVETDMYSDFINTIEDVDALYTFDKNVGLIVKTADCLPVLISHPSGLIAVCHAGRRGTESKILFKIINHFYEKYGFKDQFVFWFGPHINYDVYQIDKVKNQYFDLKGENLNQIISSNINSYQIHFSDYCTFKNSDLFYSHRNNAAIDQRQFSLIMNI